MIHIYIYIFFFRFVSIIGYYNIVNFGVPFVAQGLMNPTRVHEDSVSTPGLRNWCDRELWCRSQMRLGSHVAVTLA